MCRGYKCYYEEDQCLVRQPNGHLNIVRMKANAIFRKFLTNPLTNHELQKYFIWNKINIHSSITISPSGTWSGIHITFVAGYGWSKLPWSMNSPTSSSSFTIETYNENYFRNKTTIGKVPGNKNMRKFSQFRSTGVRALQAWWAVQSVFAEIILSRSMVAIKNLN